MPFEFGEFINYFVDALLNAPIVRTIANNPIYTALMITFVVILIILFIFRDATTDESLIIMSLRSGFWILILLIGTLFIHNRVLSSEVENDTKTGQYDTIFNGAYENISSDVVPVHIDMTGL